MAEVTKFVSICQKAAHKRRLAQIVGFVEATRLAEDQEMIFSA